jgi:hypothetical protein
MKRVVLAFVLAACGGASEPPATPAAPVAPAAASPNGGRLTVTRASFAGIAADTPPTISGVAKALGSDFKVTTDLVTKKVVAKRGDGVTFEIVPSATGTKIATVRTTSDAVEFPWETTVGMTLGSHRHWSKMTCKAGAADTAVCYADPKGAFQLEVNHTGVFPAKDAFTEKRIEALVWKPAGEQG